MGFFSGPKTKIKWTSYLQKLPQGYQDQATRIGGEALNNLDYASREGTTPEAAALFNASRADTVRRFGPALTNAGSALVGVGPGTSGANMDTSSLAQALMGGLSKLNTMRAADLNNRKLAAGAQGVQTTLRMAGETTPIITNKGPGLGYRMIPAMAGLVGGAFGGSIGGMAASKAAGDILDATNNNITPSIGSTGSQSGLGVGSSYYGYSDYGLDGLYFG
jgi:hypothetical protein